MARGEAFLNARGGEEEEDEEQVPMLLLVSAFLDRALREHKMGFGQYLRLLDRLDASESCVETITKRIADSDVNNATRIQSEVDRLIHLEAQAAEMRETCQSLVTRVSKLDVVQNSTEHRLAQSEGWAEALQGRSDRMNASLDAKVGRLDTGLKDAGSLYRQLKEELDKLRSLVGKRDLVSTVPDSILPVAHEPASDQPASNSPVSVPLTSVPPASILSKPALPAAPQDSPLPNQPLLLPNALLVTPTLETLNENEGEETTDDEPYLAGQPNVAEEKDVQSANTEISQHHNQSTVTGLDPDLDLDDWAVASGTRDVGVEEPSGPTPVPPEASLEKDVEGAVLSPSDSKSRKRNKSGRKRASKAKRPSGFRKPAPTETQTVAGPPSDRVLRRRNTARESYNEHAMTISAHKKQ